jgi:integrase
MATIEERGDFQYRVKIRLRGVRLTQTFERLRDAQEWVRIQEGRISGDEYVDRRLSKMTSLTKAIDFYETQGVNRSKADAKNKFAKLRYWRDSRFASWSLVSLKSWDLIAWRREVLDEDNAEDGEAVGLECECSAQTVVHRLNVLSQVYKFWILHRDNAVINPVVDGVRPSLDNRRERRLQEGEEERLLKVLERSSRPWLKAAAIISIETAMRQAELAGITHGRLHLKGPNPHVLLPKTKNNRARTVPLSKRAVAAFKSLIPKSRPAPTATVFPIETPRAIGHAWRDIITDEFFPDLRWHDLRHEAISRLFEETDLRDNEIMAVTGHIRPEMLTRYTHLRTARLASRLG